MADKATAGAAGAFDLPFAEQIGFFRRKLNLPTEAWDDIRKAAHDRAFVVAGAMKADLLQDLREAVAKAIAAGTTLETFRKDFRQIVAKHGWTGWTGEGSKAGEAWRTKVIYETNLRTSYAAGRWAQLTDADMVKNRPFWRYVHNDSVLHPRPLHKRWGDMRLTLPHDHLFWQTHFPPNGWGCRCRVTAVTGPKDGDATEPPAGWRAIDPKTGAPMGIDKGWAYAPGANAATPLADLVGQKLLNLDAPIGAAMWEQLAPALAMERRLAWYDTVDAWRASGPVGARRHHVVGALQPSVLDWLRTERQIEPASAEIAVQDNLVLGPKERRHQERSRDGLTDAEWRRLPELLDAPEQVLFHERTGHLLFVLPAGEDAAQKIAVEFDYRIGKKTDARELNMIVSAYRQAMRDIDGEVKGGVWVPVE
ncbi:Phage Mu protein F like protein [Aromatoleum tolulyticum]|uniref:Phage Mu protein F like protein n=1 Tax=Aromatoleum tolulyticum TaxID=34027 RepID=A0A1N6X1C4_9RHOO|nr:phage minor head protein [Aromatoleum tolulyticum]SIQ96174.1 Phage Mu protein F like protein [Aromatoleum tolulyticum]